MVDDIKAVRLMQGRGKFGQKAVCRDTYVAAHPFSDFLPEAFLISRPRSRIEPLYRQRVSVRSITASSMDFGVTSGSSL